MNQTDEIEATEENEDELYEHHRFVIDKKVRSLIG